MSKSDAVTFQDAEKGLTSIELSQLPQNGYKKLLLHQAVENSDLTTVFKLVQKEDINMKDNDGNTALHLAIKREHIYSIIWLIGTKRYEFFKRTEEVHTRQKADINATNNKGQTPLHLALDKGNKGIISILLSQEEIDLDSAKYNGKSCRDMLEKKWIVMYMFYMLYQKKTKNFIDLAKTNRSLLEEDDGYRTFLQYACYKGLTDVVEALLDLNVNPIRKSQVPPLTIDKKIAKSYIVDALRHLFVNPIRESQKPPLKIAIRMAESNKLEILRMLLKHPLIGGETNNNGNTALHIAVKLQTDQFFLKKDDKIDLIKCLFEDTDNTDIIAMNKEGQTPLHLAIAEGNEEVISIFIHQKDIDLDSHRYEGKSCRDILEEKYPMIILRYFSHHGKIEEFIDLVEKTDRKVLEGISGYNLLKHACSEGSINIVKILLDMGIDPNKRFDDDPMSPLNIAIDNGFHEILQLLLENPRFPAKISQNVLFRLVKGHRDSLDKKLSEKVDYMKCLKLLSPEIQSAEFDINLLDEHENTILHFVDITDDNFTLEVLKLDPFIGHKDILTRLQPSLVKKHLNNCISTRKIQFKKKDINEIAFNYKSLVPPPNLNPSVINIIFKNNQSTASVETGLFVTMGEIPEFRQLLKHPVLTSFLDLKWFAMRKFFYINVMFYFTFCILLTAYVTREYVSWSSLNSSTNGDVAKSSIFNPLTTNFLKLEFDMLHIVTVLSWIVFTIRESSQFLFSLPSYIKSPENWLEISTVLTGGYALLFQSTCVDYELLVLVTLSLSSWGEAVLLIGRHPKLSIYITMFKRVIWNFLAFLLLYIILIWAFALSFYFLFSQERKQKEDDSFKNPLVAFFQILIMMTGEFNSSEFQFNMFPLISRIIFLSFVFLIAIVLLSLLNGLAVGDIQTIRSEAELSEIIYRIQMFQYNESFPVLTLFLYTLDWLIKAKWLNEWTREKCAIVKSLFSVTLFPNVIPKPNYKCYVYRNFNNVVSYCPADKSFFKGLENSYFKRFFTWKINSDIVEAAEMVIEEKIKNNITNTAEDLVGRCSEQLKLHESKFETMEKMLIQCTENLHVVRNIFERFHGLEQIAESN